MFRDDRPKAAVVDNAPASIGVAAAAAKIDEASHLRRRARRGCAIAYSIQVLPLCIGVVHLCVMSVTARLELRRITTPVDASHSFGTVGQRTITASTAMLARCVAPGTIAAAAAQVGLTGIIPHDVVRVVYPGYLILGSIRIVDRIPLVVFGRQLWSPQSRLRRKRAIITVTAVQ